jgi:hypothetical protein
MLTIIYTFATIIYGAAAAASFYFGDVLAGCLFTASATILACLTIDEVKKGKNK